MTTNVLPTNYGAVRDLSGSESAHQFTKIPQNRGIIDRIKNIATIALKPFLSLYAMAQNYKISRSFLTSDRVFHSLNTENCFLDGGNALDSIRGKLETLQDGEHVAVHLGCLHVVPHSTLLVIGKEANGTPYALFFDGQAHNPEKAKLIGEDHETVSTFYQKIVKDSPFQTVSPVTLGQAIQKDWVSCTAYSAKFFQNFLNKKSNRDFDPQLFMEGIQAGENMGWSDVRKLAATKSNIQEAIPPVDVSDNWSETS